MEINDTTGIIIEESIKIHTDLGPGLPESVYEELLAYCFNKNGIKGIVNNYIPAFSSPQRETKI